MKLLGISSPFTGSGKTTVTLTIGKLLNDSAIFKIGPDFIDTGLARNMTGYAENIDRYLQGREYKKILCEASTKYKYGILEGVMGLYDSGLNFDNSTYYYFKKLRVPHIIVVDVSRMAESAYRIFKGFKNEFTIGVILNNYYGEKHLNMVKKEFLKRNIDIFGEIPHLDTIKINERHLGLYTFMEEKNLIEKIKRVEKYLNKKLLLEKLSSFNEFKCNSDLEIKRRNVNISIAMDLAFNFYYQYNINLLSSIGNVRFFSPLKNEEVENSQFIYLGGGYPELYKNELSKSYKTKESILKHYENGATIYGECGGLMYMMEKIEDKNMLGIFEGKVIENKGLTLNYTELLPKNKFFIFNKDEIIYGHEFHYSSIETDEKLFLSVLRGKGINGEDGFSKNRAFGMYTHIHFFRYRNNIEKYINKIYKADIIK